MGRSKKNLSGEWKTPREMRELLNVCDRTLMNLRIKTLKHKEHWINLTPHGARPSYRYHGSRILKHLGLLQDELDQVK